MSTLRLKAFVSLILSIGKGTGKETFAIDPKGFRAQGKGNNMEIRACGAAPERTNVTQFINAPRTEKLAKFKCFVRKE